MKVLALQLKRIGDLVLTTPALAALKGAGAHITLAVHESTAGLLPAIPHFDAAIVFRRAWTPWQQVLTGHFDVVLDFTGTDRSALATFLARAQRRAAFEWVRRNSVRSLPYNEFVASSVRERHTADHYLDLVAPITPEGRAAARPILCLPEIHGRAAARPSGHAVLHPGTARAEKNWLPERWAEVARHVAGCGLEVVVTTGPAAAEQAHAGATGLPVTKPRDLCAFAALLRDAAIVVSCDTAAVHLTAAFQRPQVALFGPTNPFHWRPRHECAAVISAAQPDAPMTTFDPWMKGAPMERISTAVVCRAIDDILAK